MIDLDKLPEIKHFYAKDYPIFHYEDVKISENRYKRYVHYDGGGTLFDINLLDHVNKVWENYMFDYEFIGKNGNCIYIQITKNKWKDFFVRNKLYIMSHVLGINYKILFTLRIWGFMDYLIGTFPSWSELKLFRKFRNK